MNLVDVDGINQHHLVIADFGNFKNNKYTNMGSAGSMNDENKNINKPNETDSLDLKKLNDKNILKRHKSSVVLNKNDIALNDNKIGIPLLKIFKGIFLNLINII